MNKIKLLRKRLRIAGAHNVMRAKHIEKNGRLYLSIEYVSMCRQTNMR